MTSASEKLNQPESALSAFDQFAFGVLSPKKFSFGLGGGLRPTDRDIEVFKFIGEMKFGYAPVIFQKFFVNRLDGEPRQTDAYVRRRLCRWKELGLIEAGYTTFNDQAIYFLTRRCQRLLMMLNLKIEYFASQRNYDPRLFDHDMKVMIARLALEKSGRALRWISERSIKSEVTIFNGLARKYLPDGLYENKTGELVAFEMEISKKSKARYQEKIDKYVVLIKANRSASARFARALFVCQNRGVFDILTAMTRFHGDIFKVEMFYDLIALTHEPSATKQIPLAIETESINVSI